MGRAYAHFAVELAWSDFHALLDVIEAKREPLLDYLARIDAGTAPGPHALCGVTTVTLTPNSYGYRVLPLEIQSTSGACRL